MDARRRGTRGRRRPRPPADERDALLADRYRWVLGAIYYEDKHAGGWPQPSGVPTGVVVTPHDISIRRYAERSNDIVHWSEFDRGGHFAAAEIPDLLLADVREFFRSLR